MERSSARCGGCSDVTLGLRPQCQHGHSGGGRLWRAHCGWGALAAGSSARRNGGGRCDHRRTWTSSLLGLGRHDGTTSEPSPERLTPRDGINPSPDRQSPIAKSVKRRHSHADHDPPPGGLHSGNQSGQSARRTRLIAEVLAAAIPGQHADGCLQAVSAAARNHMQGHRKVRIRVSASLQKLWVVQEAAPSAQAHGRRQRSFVIDRVDATIAEQFKVDGVGARWCRAVSCVAAVADRRTQAASSHLHSKMSTGPVYQLHSGPERFVRRRSPSMRRDGKPQITVARGIPGPSGKVTARPSCGFGERM